MAALSAGSFHSCAVYLNRPRDNTVACWGDTGDERSTPSKGLQARLSADTLWLAETAESIAGAISLEPTAFVNINTARSVIPEGSTVSILVHARTIAKTVAITAVISPENTGIKPPDVLMLSAASTAAEIPLFVPVSYTHLTLPTKA